MRRDILSAPHALFGFINKYSGSKVEWWASAHREWWTMIGLIMAMVADIGAPLANCVFATDAMGASEIDAGGYGIVGANVSPELALATFECGTAPGFTVSRLDGDIRALHNPAKELQRTVPYTKVPDVLFEDSTKWEPIAQGRWTWEDHITLGEARAVTKLAALLARCPLAHRHKVISLQDNRPCQGANNKGRSCAHQLNVTLRKKAGNTIAARLNLILPWTASALMPADELSRQVVHQPRLDRSTPECEDQGGHY